MRTLKMGEEMSLAERMQHFEAQGQIVAMAAKEMRWPKKDMALLCWYYNRLGMNKFLEVWQEQSYQNEKKEPDSRFGAFRARLGKAYKEGLEIRNMKGGAR